MAIWHQSLFAGILAQTGKKHVVIVSRSKDARPVVYLCEKLGHHVAQGSSRGTDGRDKGGKLALQDMTAQLKLGLPGAVTVDGPKGPAKEVKKGIVIMAKEANIPIVAYKVSPRRYWQFNSWDKFRLPKPFTTIDIHYGKPISVENISVEEGQQLVEDSLKTS